MMIRINGEDIYVQIQYAVHSSAGWPGLAENRTNNRLVTYFAYGETFFPSAQPTSFLSSPVDSNLSKRFFRSAFSPSTVSSESSSLEISATSSSCVLVVRIFSPTSSGEGSLPPLTSLLIEVLLEMLFDVELKLPPEVRLLEVEVRFVEKLVLMALMEARAKTVPAILGTPSFPSFSLRRNRIFGTNKEQRILPVMMDTKMVFMKVSTFGSSWVRLRTGTAKSARSNDINSALAIDLLSANSVDKCRALHAWMRARATMPKLTTAIGIRNL